MISDEAVEAAARVHFERSGSYWEDVAPDAKREALDDMRAALEVTAPILLSHERQLTADAHRDAIVNRDTADRLERQLEEAKADAWDEGWQACVNFSTYPELDGEIPDSENPYRSLA